MLHRTRAGCKAARRSPAADQRLAAGDSIGRDGQRERAVAADDQDLASARAMASAPSSRCSVSTSGTGSAVQRDDDVAARECPRPPPASRARTVSIRTPDSRGNAKWRTMRRGSGSVCPPTPRQRRRTRPSRISAIATRSAVDDAMAEADPLRRQGSTAVLTPMTSPRASTQRTARVAGIERRVGLQHVVEQASRLRAHRAAERADDARRHRVLESERAADGDGDLADAHAGRIAEADPCEIARLRPSARRGPNRDRRRRFARRPCGRPASVTSMRSGAARHVAVGDEIAVGRDEGTRSRRLPSRRAGLLRAFDADDGRPQGATRATAAVTAREYASWVRADAEDVRRGGRRCGAPGGSSGAVRRGTARE